MAMQTAIRIARSAFNRSTFIFPLPFRCRADFNLQHWLMGDCTHSLAGCEDKQLSGCDFEVISK
jgi:hypothetical protein